MLTAGVVAALGGSSFPLVGEHVAELSIAGVADPLDAVSALWSTLSQSHAFLLETVALAAAAAAVGALRHRGPWGAAAFASLFLALTLLAAPAGAALPLVAAAWVSALLLALEPGPTRPIPQFLARLPRIPLMRPRLRALSGS